MKIHHLNCGSICPLGGLIPTGQSHLVCHCLLIETPRGLVLVDTGLGLADIANPVERLGFPFAKIVRPKLNADETAIRQILRLGFKPQDVRHIIMTHLDVDHAGGISDFPWAQVHLSEIEFQDSQARSDVKSHLRYHPKHWNHGVQWVRHSPIEGDSWNGFQSVRVLDETMPELLLVPMAGHTRGHCGVAIRQNENWLFHAGDAYYFHAQMWESRAHSPFALQIFELSMQINRSARLANQQRLRLLKNDANSKVQMFCSHDLQEFEKLAAIKY